MRALDQTTRTLCANVELQYKITFVISVGVFSIRFIGDEARLRGYAVGRYKVCALVPTAHVEKVKVKKWRLKWPRNRF